MPRVQTEETKRKISEGMRRSQKTKKECIIFGLYYPSLKMAAETLNMTPAGVRYYINSKLPKYELCYYLSKGK